MVKLTIDEPARKVAGCLHLSSIRAMLIPGGPFGGHLQREEAAVVETVPWKFSRGQTARLAPAGPGIHPEAEVRVLDFLDSLTQEEMTRLLLAAGPHRPFFLVLYHTMALEHASKEIKSPILIRIEAGIVQDPGSFDPQAPKPKWDTVIFETSGNLLKAVNIETPAYLLNEVGKSEDLRGLAKSIPEIQMAGWIWVDFFMGSIFERISPALAKDTWGAGDLWRKALSNWEPWFR
uniref:Uncharacterized protein n=1 Tax=Desulfobacca acetoxidans TaxID=60893 RepID=A0A7C5AMS9_9BACT